jgi:molecular chaperone HtpG
MERILGGTVSAVRVSLRLRGSPCVMVTSRDDPGMLVRSFLKASGKDPGEVPGVLEINPGHPMILEMHRLFGSDRSGGRLETLTRLARDLGLVLAGSPPADPVAFAAEVAGLVAGV